MLSVFTFLALPLAFIAAMTEGGGAVYQAPKYIHESCSNTDVECWNRNALIFTNRFRAQEGLGPLVLGPARMLEIAVKHSRAQAAHGGIYHQDMKTLKLGCGMQSPSENTGVLLGSGSVLDSKSEHAGKPASHAFVDGWIKSEGHRKNILGRKAGDKVVVGIITSKASGNRRHYGRGIFPTTYGTQIFARGDPLVIDSTCHLLSGSVPLNNLRKKSPVVVTTTPAPVSAHDKCMAHCDWKLSFHAKK